MSALLGNLIFLNPWILAGLAALPVLWFLLRITPPAPKLVSLPTARFLAGLIPESQTPDRTPWWILLLRLLIAALVLLALAHPVFKPAGTLPGTGPLRLVIDNGWAAAQTWDLQIKAAQETIARAGREDRPVYILTTAPAPGSESPAMFGPLAHAEAASILKGLQPLPWAADYEITADFIKAQTPQKNVQSLWFGHGLDEGGLKELTDILLQQGGLIYTKPAPEQLPLLLKQPEDTNYSLEIAVTAPAETADGLPVTVQAMTEDGRILDRQTENFNAGRPEMLFRFDIPETLRNEVSQFKIAGRSGVGGLFVLDDRFHKRAVGIVGPADESETKPFIEATYYLKRALEPFTTLYMGDVEEIIAREPSVIILPDIGAMPAQTLNGLESWVREGGMLLRFAGSNMTKEHGADFLVPVPLRHNLRSTEGSLSWENPPKLKEFLENSPLHGVPVFDDIAVRQQILPEPSEDMNEKIWAALDDGTPLITAAPLDKGLLVMVHTSASPDWSDLALSGTYVEILRRLINISGKPPSQLIQEDGVLQPVWVFDGFGAVKTPDGTVKPVSAAAFADTPPGPEHPPGLYARGGHQQIMNLGDHITYLKTPRDMPVAVQTRGYDIEYERDLMPFILYAALALVLFDWLVMIIMMTELRLLARFTAIALLAVSFPAHAQSVEDDTKYADGLYLAYIRTGDSILDSNSQNGLENLMEVLKRRTSAEPEGVAGVNPETDALVFFPLIYWPVSALQENLSDKALKNIQHYLDHGGTILFDTHDQNYAGGSLSGSRNTDILRNMIGALDIPPLAPINKDHVLGRSFYLLESYPGRYSGGTLWVETTSANGRDGVSSVIIGSHDWAESWAAGRGERSSLTGGSRQQELAYRFGVNIVMYALTGNYKADQVHVPYILERLGQ